MRERSVCIGEVVSALEIVWEAWFGGGMCMGMETPLSPARPVLAEDVYKHREP